MKPFSIVVAATQRGGIGLNGTLPWPTLKSDLKHFAHITTTIQTHAENTNPNHKLYNAVIMGHKTWQSLPSKYAPLPNRINIILTRNVQHCIDTLNTTYKNVNTVDSKIYVSDSIDNALKLCCTGDLAPHIASIYCIGGAQIYNIALQSQYCDTIYYTAVFNDYKCDTYMTTIDRSVYELDTMSDVVTENDTTYQFQTYKRILHNNNTTLTQTLKQNAALQQHDEMQYLNLVRNVIEHGNVRTDRTGTGTKSLFGQTMRFSLQNNTFPLLTTKRVFWRGVVEELLWIIRGQTNSKILAEKKVHIWDDNGSRKFLDNLGFTERSEGDLGPVYGFQWRHFGAEYKDCNTTYTGQGVDQLQRIIDLINTNPTDRRLVLNAWNAADLNKMALPPCHVMCQFYVSGANNEELSCTMYQRSADLGLGVPFNIASYSLLTYIIAHITNKKPKEFIHILGDAHVYLNHIEPLQEQLKRTPNAFPTLKIKNRRDKIDDYVYDDFELCDYKPQDTIKMTMAV